MEIKKDDLFYLNKIIDDLSFVLKNTNKITKKRFRRQRDIIGFYNVSNNSNI